jgi:hypothetical protein
MQIFVLGGAAAYRVYPSAWAPVICVVVLHKSEKTEAILRAVAVLVVWMSAVMAHRLGSCFCLALSSIAAGMMPVCTTMAVVWLGLIVRACVL